MNIEALLAPAPGDSPSGVSLRYQPVYDQIRDARREDDPAVAQALGVTRKEADFERVLQLTTEALTNSSKDLQLAAWHTEALLATRGFAGLAEGLYLMRELLARFWDTLYPELEEGDPEMRAGVLEWVGKRFKERVCKVALSSDGLDYNQVIALRTRPTDPGDALNDREIRRAADGTPRPFFVRLGNELQQALAALKALEEECEARFSEPPSLWDLQSTLREVQAVVTALLALKPAEWTAEAAGDGQPAAAQAAADPHLLVIEAARAMRLSDQSNPVPYLLVRALQWGELRRDPPREPPSGALRAHLRELREWENWAALLSEAEAAMEEPCGRAWLDLQWYISRSAGQLGFRELAGWIAGSTAALVSLLPDLVDRRLADDTPAASEETRDWLRQMASAAPAEGPPAARAAAPESIDAVARQAGSEQCGRARFLRKLELARLALDQGYSDLARALAEDLAREIDERTLENWEAAETVASPLELLIRCLEGDAERKAQLYARLCRLAPARALAIARER